MRKAKHLLMAAIVAMSTLAAGAPPRLAAAELPAAEAAQIPDGWYTAVDADGRIAGWFHMTNDVMDIWIDNPSYDPEGESNQH